MRVPEESRASWSTKLKSLPTSDWARHERRRGRGQDWYFENFEEEEEEELVVDVVRSEFLRIHGEEEEEAPNQVIVSFTRKILRLRVSWCLFPYRIFFILFLGWIISLSDLSSYFMGNICLIWTTPLVWGSLLINYLFILNINDILY